MMENNEQMNSFQEERQLLVIASLESEPVWSQETQKSFKVLNINLSSCDIHMEKVQHTHARV